MLLKTLEVTEVEEQFILQGLDLLLDSKREAFSQAAREQLAFTKENFGIPQILNLLGRIDGSTEWDQPESEVSS